MTNVHCPGCGQVIYMMGANGLGLTRAQRIVMDAVASLLMEQPQAPSYREIALRAGLKSRGNVSEKVHALIERGYLTMAFNAPRSIALTDAGRALYQQEPRHA